MPTPTPSVRPRQTGRQLHRREVLRQMVMPFLLAMLVLVGLVMVMVVPRDELVTVRAEAFANFFSLLCLICPTIIILFAVNILVIVMVYGVNKLHSSTEAPLTRLEKLTQQMRERVEKTTDTVNQQAISASEKLAPLLKVMSVFDKPNSTEADDGRK